MLSTSVGVDTLAEQGLTVLMMGVEDRIIHTLSQQPVEVEAGVNGCHMICYLLWASRTHLIHQCRYAQL